MKIKLLSACVALSLTGLANESAAAEFEVSTSATLVSQYIFRGLDASQEDPALQGDVTVEHKSGFSFGAWASTYDFGFDEDGIEIDLVAGYSTTLSNDITIGVGLTEYTYSGDADSSTEFNVTAGFSHYTVGYYRDVDLDTDYFSGDAEFQIAKDISLNLHVGNASPDDGDSETDFAIGVGYAASKQLSLFASFSDHSAEGADSYFVVGGTYSF